MNYKCGTIAIVGRPNVGKSTLLNHLVGQKISITSRKAQTTRHRVTGIVTQPDAQFVFVDTPGFQTKHVNALNKTMNRSVVQSLSQTDVVLFVIEAMKFSEADRQLISLLPTTRPVLLVMNKIDREKDKGELLPFMDDVSKEFAFAALVPVSAKQGTQLDTLLEAIQPYLPENEAMFGEDEITDRNERFLASEFVREKLFRLLGEELPYSTSVEIEKFEVVGKLRRIFASILVEKDNQKAIVIGEKGAKLKIIGTDARKDMEKLFGGPVYLELHVKVKSGWADDERTLKRLGYE
jgi:GTP-binding protein Era